MTAFVFNSFLRFSQPFGCSLKRECFHLSRGASSLAEPQRKKNPSTMNVSRFPVNNIKELPVSTQELMYKVDDKSGFIPNLFHALANRPEQFKRFIQYKDAIARRENCKLKKEDMELIGLATSVTNGCMYCVIAHSALHRSFSRNPYLADQVAVNPDAAELSPRQRAIICMALAVAKCEPITEQHFIDLADHGLDKDDAWDIASMAAFTSMANIMTQFLKVKPNEEYYNMGR